MRIIAHIANDYREKFGVPRQSGLAENTLSRLIFEPEFRIPEAFRGLEEYSHLWLLWCFSENEGHGWSPTVRPPKLGGNERRGVFATRSPFRPSPIGLSCVRIVALDPQAEDGACLTVAGADLMNGTPVYDIKPYIPYTDARPDARGGFGEALHEKRLKVEFPEKLQTLLSEEERAGLLEMLALDPRPGYHRDPERIYGIAYGEANVRFRVEEDVLYVIEITRNQGGNHV